MKYISLFFPQKVFSLTQLSKKLNIHWYKNNCLLSPVFMSVLYVTEPESLKVFNLQVQLFVRSNVFCEVWSTQWFSCIDQLLQYNYAYFLMGLGTYFVLCIFYIFYTSCEFIMHIMHLQQIDKCNYLLFCVSLK